MFTVEERERVRDRVLAMAAADQRVVAGAVVGSLALDEGDRWSDLDLTFAVADGTPVRAVLEDWTRTISAEFDAAHLFDLPSGTSLYRVFLLPGCLQFDLSFTPATSFGATGPKFRLLFGTAVEKPHVPAPSPHELFGYAAHHAVRARFCIARGRLWQAEYWMHGVRDYALSLACLRYGLSPYHGRGYDALPEDVRASFQNTLARTLEPEEVLRALTRCVASLLREAGAVPELQPLLATIAPELRDMCGPTCDVWDAL